jgi:peptidoglycan/LPS O-acetylase OafA/YrhL
MALPDPASHRGEIKALTSLRGAAAIAVVLQHFSATAQQATHDWIPSLVPHGYMAVDFFFVLSGFIMSYTYLAGFESMGMRAYLPFLWKRVARIVPLGLAITAIILLAAGIASLWNYDWLFIMGTPVTDGLRAAVLINILHLQGFFPRYNLNDPSWSISVELGAYLVFPALIYLLFKVPRWVTTLYIIAGICLMVQITAFSENGRLGYWWAPFDLVRCIVEFGFGMIVYRVFRARSPLQAIGRDGWTWAVSAICVGLFITRIDLLIALSFPFVVLAFALNRGVPSRILSSQVPYFLGTISFSIYLVHHMFRRPEIVLAKLFYAGPLPPLAALLFVVLGSLSVLPFAALAYYTIERPGRTALNSVVRKLNRARVEPVAVRGPVG